jgi:hypothetical protein
VGLQGGCRGDVKGLQGLTAVCGGACMLVGIHSMERSTVGKCLAVNSSAAAVAHGFMPGCLL